jgi:Flp pilus assembly protein TadD
VLADYGKALADVGRFREASAVLARAHRPERPDWRILNVQGAVADQQGDFATAQRFYVAALRIAPGEPSILTNQGLSFALAKRLDEAERTLSEASRHPRADGRVRQNLALVLGLQGRFAEAETVLKRDLTPAEATSNMQAIRRMVSHANSWKAIRQAEEPAREKRQAAAL